MPGSRERGTPAHGSGVCGLWIAGSSFSPLPRWLSAPPTPVGAGRCRLEVLPARRAVAELVAQVALDAKAGAVRAPLRRADRLDLRTEAVSDVLGPGGSFVLDLGEPATARTGNHVHNARRRRYSAA